MLEFAVSFAGLIMFIYVLLNVWGWLNGMMMGRQQAFQQTRLAAGQEGSAGLPVGYVRPPIRLVGLPSSPGGDPPVTDIDIDPPCTAAEPFFQQAKDLLAESLALAKQAMALSPEIEALGARLKQLTAQIHVECHSCGRRRTCCSVVGPFAQINATQAELAAKAAHVRALTEQTQAKVHEAQGLIAQGEAACP